MTPRIAKTIARVALVIAATLALGVVVLPLLFADRIPAGQIVVVGDPTVGDTVDVIDHVDCDRRTPDTLTTPSVILVAPNPGASTSEVPWVRKSPCDPMLATGDPLRPSGISVVSIVFALVGLGWLATGALIVSRQPRNVAGWTFAFFGLTLVAEDFATQAVLVGTKAGVALPLMDLWALIGDNGLLAMALLPLLFLLFPDGQPPTRRWRWAEWALFAGAGCAVVGYVVTAGPMNNFVDLGVVYLNPLGVTVLGDAPGTLTAVGVIITVVAALSTVLAVRGRFKRSTGEERQQLRWLVAVASAAATLFVLAFGVALPLGEYLPETSRVFDILIILFALTVALGVPAAYLVAIFRYRLWDLDVVIKKTLIFGVVTGGITLVAFGVVLVLPVSVFGTGLSGWERGVLVLGVVIGLLVGPLRRLARRLADRIVYGERATPYEVLTEFSGRVGETYATDDVLPRMAQILANGTGASSARVWLRVGGALQEAAAFGEASGGDELRVPVIHQGDELGALAVTMPANDPIDPSREKLVRDVAAQAGLVLRNVRLIEELRASRQRLVAAQDEERRRIERNIHDGAQQQLVAMAVQLKLADGLVEREPTKARELLTKLQAASNEALDDLRDLARGIYPPLLADKGLAAALAAQARKAAVPTTVNADGVGRYPQNVESTVYFCCLEALNNVAKYAQASAATVELWHSNGSIVFCVTDDGRGFDAITVERGTGLQGMADRLDAIGGSLTVASTPGGGTVIEGRAPAGGGAR